MNGLSLETDLEVGKSLWLLPLHLIEGWAEHPLRQVLPGIGC